MKTDWEMAVRYRFEAPAPNEDNWNYLFPEDLLGSPVPTLTLAYQGLSKRVPKVYERVELVRRPKPVDPGWEAVLTTC